MAKTLVLFDIDGTLCLTKGAGRESTARAMLDMFGNDANIRDLPIGGKTDWQILHEMLTEYGQDTSQIESIMASYEARMAHHLEAIIHEYPAEACPGAHELVDALYTMPNIVLGVVTGNTSLTAPIKLKAVGFDFSRFVANAYGSESITRNALPALAISRARQVTGHDFQPHEIIVIGDTVADIECARASKAIAVAVQTGFEKSPQLQAAQPDYLLRDLTEFLDTVPLPHPQWKDA
jgi:phosphoglycolate phosphatase